MNEFLYIIMIHVVITAWLSFPICNCTAPTTSFWHRINNPNRKAALQIQPEKYITTIRLGVKTTGDGVTIAVNGIHLYNINSIFIPASDRSPSSRDKSRFTIEDVMSHADNIMLKLAGNRQTHPQSSKNFVIQRVLGQARKGRVRQWPPRRGRGQPRGTRPIG